MMSRFVVPRLVLLLALPMGLLVSSCVSTPNQAALALLAKADSLSLEGSYPEALACVEEAITLAPADTAILRQSTDQKRTIHRREAEYMLVALDSQLRQVNAAIQEAARGFVIERNEAYDTPPRYIAPELTPSRLGTRPHLRLSVDEEGLKFVSVYAGKTSVQHSAMRLSLAGVDSTYTTPEVPYDEALNYRYTDAASTRWELVTYPVEEALRMTSYLQAGLERGSALSVELLSQGKSVRRLEVSKTEREAMLRTLRLGALKGQQRELLRQQAVYAQRFSRLSN